MTLSIGGFQIQDPEPGASDPSAVFAELCVKFRMSKMVGTHLVDKCKCVNLEDLAYLFTSIEEIGPKCIDKITELDA